MNNKVFRQFEESISSIETLVELVEKYKSENLSQLQIYCLFTEYQEILEIENRQKELDNIYDVLDKIYGWCFPQEKLFEKSLTNKQIEEYRFVNNL